ncbi:PREDICTED: cylicin-1 [Miniopterus natalensis]|uniref:cylicin-1 n=1 Tax=Miniopterus natalensis TaxID=291302 RepID=UPI0007A6A6BC|nr:PREDICTED: cylicin-1 [Miniopterus natalensis]
MDIHSEIKNSNMHKATRNRESDLQGAVAPVPQYQTLGVRKSDPLRSPGQLISVKLVQLFAQYPGTPQVFSFFNRQEVNIKAYDNSMPISKSSRKLWNQECFTLTIPKPPQPGRKKRSRPSELQITVPRCDKRKLEEVHKPPHIWIRHFLRKIFQRPSNYFTVSRQAPFSHPCTPKTHPGKAESKKLEDYNKRTTFKKDSKKNTGPHETAPESKETGNNKKPKRGDKTDKTPSKSSHESEISTESKYKSGTNPKSKDSQAVLMKQPKKCKRDFKNSKETDIESICTKKESKSSKNNFNAKSEACSINISNMDLMTYLEESGAESMEFGMWLNNYSQNNSKKPSKKEAKKSSDAESSDSKDTKKDKKGKGKNKKKDAKETESTDAESESELESKKDKKDSKKGKKGSKKDDKKKDAKKDMLSTDEDPESEQISKKDEKVEKTNKRESKKDDKKKTAMKSEESSETESDWDSKKEIKAKRKSKKDAKKQDAKKSIESTDDESDLSSKKEEKKPGMNKSSDAESEESMHKPRAKNKGVDESDATSTDSKKEALEIKKDFKTSFRKTTFKEKEKQAVAGRVPPSRESSLPSPCEPLQLSPKIKRLCRCKMDPLPPKPRYAPLHGRDKSAKIREYVDMDGS